MKLARRCEFQGSMNYHGQSIDIVNIAAHGKVRATSGLKSSQEGTGGHDDASHHLFPRSRLKDPRSRTDDPDAGRRLLRYVADVDIAACSRFHCLLLRYVLSVS